jgi:glutamine synthetase
MKRLAEYIWIDGTEPTPSLRSKTKVLKEYEKSPIWGFDGSSTNQAPGDASDCVLRPVYECADPIRGYPNILVMCEVLNTNMDPHKTNNRAFCSLEEQRSKDHEPWFGLEQEYTLIKNEKPLGWPNNGLNPPPQGQYYCSVGSENTFGREIADEHARACIAAGLTISGINAEVCPGQWEFQIGPTHATRVSDEIWVARWLLERIAEQYGIEVSYDPKPVAGDWNGAGCHTNFSTIEMRENYDAIIAACEALGENTEQHIQNYGHNIEARLTGDHETCSYKEFKYGVSDRGASIRIPWQVAKDQKGYLEDRRPNANCDPYLVTAMLLKTVCRT